MSYLYDLFLFWPANKVTKHCLWDVLEGCCDLPNKVNQITPKVAVVKLNEVIYIIFQWVANCVYGFEFFYLDAEHFYYSRNKTKVNLGGIS